jgi:hypothetical protein
MTAKQSIRTVANNMFLERLPTRAAQGNLLWRKGIILDLVELTGCTIAAASTHYNYAFKRIKESEPELVAGLGRPEGKNNGGRKRKQVPAQPKYFQPSGMLLLGYTPAPVNLDALLQAPLVPLLPAAQQQEPEPTTYKVVRCKDTSEVATGLSKEDAQAMLDKAAAGKKAKLMMIRE